MLPRCLIGPLSSCCVRHSRGSPEFARRSKQSVHCEKSFGIATVYPMSTHFLRSDIPTQLDTFPCRSRWRHTPRSARSETEQTPLLTVWIVLRDFPSYGENWQHYQIDLTYARDKKITAMLCALCNLAESCPIRTLGAAERCRSADACWLHKTQYPRILLIVGKLLFQGCLRDATHIVHLYAFHKAPLRPFWRCPCPELP